MKKIIIYLLISGGTAFVSSAQIGINTDNPKQLFHLDGASSPSTTNPVTGVVSATQATDDVVINSLGNIGIGTTSPSTKLHIASGAIKIEDGSQANRKVLISDSDGYTSWASISGTWFAGLYGGSLPITQTPGQRKVTNFPSSIISSSINGNVNKVDGSITVPFAGYYKIVLSAWFANTFNSYPTNTLYIAYPWVYVNNTPRYQPNVVGLAPTYGVSPTFIQFMKLAPNDIISISNMEGISNTNQLNTMMLVVEFMQ